MTARDDSEACKLTPCGPLGATTGRSQASEPSHRSQSAASKPLPTASDVAGWVVPQGSAPAQPAGPAGGPARSRGAAIAGVCERDVPVRARQRPSALRCVAASAPPISGAPWAARALGP
jgi:hypothetical protein